MRKEHWILAVLMILAPCAAFGQSKTGTSIGQFLLIEPGARLAGMGNTGVAITGGNPVRLLQLRLSARSMGSPSSSPIATGSPTSATTMLRWPSPPARMATSSRSVTALNSGDIDVRTVEKPLGTGERYNVRDLAIGVGYGRPITDRFSAGLQVNYVDETIWHSSMSTFTFNLGTVYKLSKSGAQLGAGISNYGLSGRSRGPGPIDQL